MTSRSYLELCQLKTFEERFEYLKLSALIGDTTFGGRRYLNQMLYHSKEWLNLKDKIIIRDNGCDLGVKGYEIIKQPIYIHHINPITDQDLINRDPKVLDPNNLICTTFNTHNAIHYGSDSITLNTVKDRTPNDTCPWKL